MTGDEAAAVILVTCEDGTACKLGCLPRAGAIFGRTTERVDNNRHVLVRNSTITP